MHQQDAELREELAAEQRRVHDYDIAVVGRQGVAYQQHAHSAY